MKRGFVVMVIGLMGGFGLGHIICAQDPAALEDAEMERRKLLRAADQIEVLLEQQASLQRDLMLLKTRVSQLEQENGQLRQLLQAQETARKAERKALLDEVSKIVAAQRSSSVSPPKPSPAKKEEGFEHTVARGESLWLIAQAYKGVSGGATVEDIRRANQLRDNNLRVGQKLFIPKVR